MVVSAGGVCTAPRSWPTGGQSPRRFRMQKNVWNPEPRTSTYKQKTFWIRQFWHFTVVGYKKKRSWH